MKRIAAAALAAFALATAPAAHAAEPAKVMVSGVWARATGGMTQSGAIFFTLDNRGPSDDRLVAVATPAAKVAQIHEMSMGANNVMHMREIGGLDVPAGKSVALAPGGYHVMLMQLANPLKAGDTFPLTLRFARSGTQTVDVTVRPMGASGPGAGHGGAMGGSPGGAMDHGNMPMGSHMGGMGHPQGQ